MNHPIDSQPVVVRKSSRMRMCFTGWLLGLLGLTLSACGPAATLNVLSPGELGHQVAPWVTATIYERDEPEIVALDIAQLTMHIELVPGFATTVLELDMFNPNSEEVEAELQFDLPAGTLVTGYALDINDVLVPGVLSPKERVRKAYEARVREGIDPGIAEVTRTNTFRNTIYPVPQNGSRTARITLVTPVSPGEAFTFPLRPTQSVGSFNLTVSQRHSGQPASVDLPSMSAVRVSERTGLSTIRGRNTRLNGDLIVRPDRVPSNWLEQREDGQRFAYWQLPQSSTVDALPIDGHVRVYWDTSLSNATSLPAQSAFVAEFLTQKNLAAIELIEFNHARWEQSELSKDTLRSTLESIEHHGGSSIDTLFEQQSTRPPVDLCVLVSDGRMTLGGLPKQALPCPLLVVSASPYADRHFLTRVATLHGGQFLDLNQHSTKAAQLATANTGSVLVKLLVDGEDRTQSAEWFRSGGRLRVVLPIDHDSKRLVAEWSDGRSAFMNVRRTPSPGHALSAWWGRQRVYLMGLNGASEAEKLTFLREHSVATEDAAFAVFEELEDYVSNDLPLPAITASEIEQLGWEDYADSVNDFQQDQQALALEYQEKLVNDWQARKEWYDTIFSNANAKPVENGAEEAGSATDRSGMAGYLSSGSGDDELEEVLVTGSRVIEYPTETIETTPWSPDRPYLKALQGLCGQAFKRRYMELVAESERLPAFYLEIGDLALDCGDRQYASDIVLSALENPQAGLETVIAVAHRLIDYGYTEFAIELGEQAMLQHEDLPQLFRIIALAHTKLAEQKSARRERSVWHLHQALDAYGQIVTGFWSDFYEGIRLVSLMEANRIIQTLARYGETQDTIDPQFVDAMELDLRLVVTWNRDVIDLDLHVQEPHGETVSYRNTLSGWGGALSNDMTDGFGPEEYVIRNARPGTYKALTDYFSDDSLNPNGPVIARIDIYKNWGRTDQTHSSTYVEFTSDEAAQYSLAKILFSDTEVR